MSVYITRKRFIMSYQGQRCDTVYANSVQHARALAMQAAYARSEAATARDDAPSAKQIRSLGLLGKEEESKELLGRG